MSVPAWPMPIQNTKFVMYSAQSCGTRSPVAPSPAHSCHVRAATKHRSRPAQIVIHPKYRFPGGRNVWSTSRLTSAYCGAESRKLNPRFSLHRTAGRDGNHDAALRRGVSAHRVVRPRPPALRRTTVAGIADASAPGWMKATLLDATGPRTWAVIFDKGDEPVAGLTAFAKAQKLGGAHLTAIGAFSDATLGYFDRRARSYRKIAITEQVEVLS